MKKILIIKNLTKNYNDNNIFNNINLTVNKGEVISIIGPSGQGKSTLLKCIAGLEKINGGEININGSIGMVFQQFNLFNNLTVINNIVIPLIIVKKKNKLEALNIANDILNKVGLINIKNSYPKMISGGQAQRTAIARTLALDRELILFDEPTSSLDPSLKREVLELILNIANNRKCSIILVTHEISFAKKISDRILIMKDNSLEEYY